MFPLVFILKSIDLLIQHLVTFHNQVQFPLKVLGKDTDIPSHVFTVLPDFGGEILSHISNLLVNFLGKSGEFLFDLLIDTPGESGELLIDLLIDTLGESGELLIDLPIDSIGESTGLFNEFAFHYGEDFSSLFIHREISFQNHSLNSIPNHPHSTGDDSGGQRSE
jgi:hypothetical protein